MQYFSSCYGKSLVKNVIIISDSVFYGKLKRGWIYVGHDF